VKRIQGLPVSDIHHFPRSAMTGSSDKIIAEFLVEDILPQVVSDMLIDSRSSSLDEEALYQKAVADVVNVLLDPTSAASNSCLSALVRIGPLDPEEVGRIYQRLRSFRLDVRKTARPTLDACARARRNQGLFYTPEPIVRYIVERTFGALKISDPLDFLSVRIMDPAVGTGAFLAEALDRLTSCVLNSQNANSLVRGHIEKIQSRFAEGFLGDSLALFPDRETAVRLHLVENCLYGVDLDPIAVAIARRVLLKRAFRSLSVVSGIETNLRVGNALIGQGIGDPSTMSRDSENLKHATACAPPNLTGSDSLAEWLRENRIFHWPLEFPEVFGAGPGRFDAVIGNPPYEIVSVRESGILTRANEQRYYRSMYRACRGKINTYRLMMERGLTLLREGGALGFIVPATLLADSTAEPLRKEILDRSEVLDAVVIPEKERVFEGVTQALLVIVTRKGRPTRAMRLSFWAGDGSTDVRSCPEMSRDLIQKTGLRIALIASEEEKLLLQALLRHPPLGGNALAPPVGRVHQGEINLSVHQDYITCDRTGHPLVRGEHVFPLEILHPAPKGNRLDWVKPEFFNEIARTEPGRQVSRRDFCRSRGNPWEQKRIVLGRVVNMATRRRLKAAIVPAGTLLGDMTNYITDIKTSTGYLLGLLNSSLLNWRLKVTSANNYLSAAEIESLPIPRLPQEEPFPPRDRQADEELNALLGGSYRCPMDCLKRLDQERSSVPSGQVSTMAAIMIQQLVQVFARVRSGPGVHDEFRANFWNMLDALVFRLYGVENFAGLNIFCR